MRCNWRRKDVYDWDALIWVYSSSFSSWDTVVVNNFEHRIQAWKRARWIERNDDEKKQKDASIRDGLGLDSIVQTRIQAKSRGSLWPCQLEPWSAVMHLGTIKSRKIFLTTNDIHLPPSNLLKPHPTPTYTNDIVFITFYLSLQPSAASYRHGKGGTTFSIAGPSNRTPRSHCPRLQAHSLQVLVVVAKARHTSSRHLVRAL